VSGARGARVRLLAAIGLLIAVGGCSSGPEKGTLEGRLLMVGGPPPGTEVPVRGVVTVTNSDGDEAVMRAGEDGRFAAEVAAGRALLKGRSPNFNGGRESCFGAVMVRAGSSVSADVLCQMR
jgi:hypothetical protein